MIIDSSSFFVLLFRNTSHGGLEAAREAAFKRAMTLMSSRESQLAQGEPEQELYTSDVDQSYGPKCPQFFLVKQKKPVPMPPLKVRQYTFINDLANFHSVCSYSV